MTAVFTWADRDTGIRLFGVSCGTCGRRVYRITTDAIVRCDGCGCDARECYCPETREIA